MPYNTPNFQLSTIDDEREPVITLVSTKTYGSPFLSAIINIPWKESSIIIATAKGQGKEEEQGRNNCGW